MEKLLWTILCMVLRAGATALLVTLVFRDGIIGTGEVTDHLRGQGVTLR